VNLAHMTRAQLVAIGADILNGGICEAAIDKIGLFL